MMVMGGSRIHTSIALWSLQLYIMALAKYLTHKHRDTHGCVVSTVAIDALVLKHQAISIHNVD